MKIRGRLMASFLACTLVPMLILTCINYWNAKAAATRVSKAAIEGLRETFSEKLTSVRELKHREVEDYFATVGNLLSSFAHSNSTIDAIEGFREGFESLKDDLNIDKSILEKQKAELRAYYQSIFGNEYSKQNNGKSADVDSRFGLVNGSGITLQHEYIVSNAQPLGNKHKLDGLDNGTAYDDTHKKFHPFIREYLDRFGLYDVFLVDSKTGNVIYTVFKELDFGTNLISGPYAGTNLGEAFRKANSASKSDGVQLVDFANYFPSYDAPASFAATPIFNGDERIGVAIFQMPIDRVNTLMSSHEGLGETGECYLVGSDNLPRSDSLFDRDNRTIINAFRHPSEGKMNSESISKALKGESGLATGENYLGTSVLTAYAPIEVLGLKWAVITEVSTKEAFKTAALIGKTNSEAQTSFLFWNVVLALVLSTLNLFFAWYIVRNLMQPIDETVRTLKDIAEGEGDLTRRLNDSRKDELGELAHWFNAFVSRIHDVVAVISGNAEILTQASAELSTTSQHLSQGAFESKTQSAGVSSAAEQMSNNMREVADSTDGMSQTIRAVAASVEEMNQTIREIARNAERSASVAGEAATLVQVSNSKISNLGSAADEIGKVIEVIQDIAEQTNLLALNATIEAARAGEAGKGFAVVATEVKELAKQTASATDDIRARIEAMQASTGEAVDSIRAISEVINNVNEVSRTIASAVEEQSITTRQISDNVSTTASAAETVARGVAETAIASREITQSISRVDSVLHQTAAGADQSRDAGFRLSKLATDMQSLIGRFRIQRNRDESTTHQSSLSA